jgi:hypothetical protein
MTVKRSMTVRRHRRGKWAIPALALAALILLAGSVLAQAGESAAAPAASGGAGNASYEVPWSTIDGGGVTFSIGGPYVVGGTIGQHDPGVHSGGIYEVWGGFWYRVPIVPEAKRVYLPVILR